MKRAEAITFRPMMIIISFLLLVASGIDATGEENEVILDTILQPVQFNTEYYVMLLDSPPLWLSRLNELRTTVLKERYRACSGGPVFFNELDLKINLLRLPIIFVSPNSSSENVVRVSTELNIKFPSTTNCENPVFWIVGAFKSVRSLSKPNNQSIFTIKKFQQTFLPTYKIVFGSEKNDLGLKRIYLDPNSIRADEKTFTLVADKPSGSFPVVFVPKNLID